jgi:ABC-type antimicrobial peptide transport system permease subunit
VHESLIGLNYVAVMLGVDAGIALLLAALGVFGVMMSLVMERTREIGVRMTFGARQKDVLRMVFQRAAVLALTGAMLGTILAVGLARIAATLFYGVSPNDVAVLVITPVTIIAIALLSCLAPARHAASIDPIQALRTE